MALSPEFLDKVRKFKKNRLAYNSLRILTFLFLLTLPAELLFNNKPIVMRDYTLALYLWLMHPRDRHRIHESGDGRDRAWSSSVASWSLLFA